MDALLTPTFFCPKAWEGMSGNEATRLCSYCHEHVHNLEALSAGERLALLSSPAGQVCARYRIALRRPKPGRKQSYARHLAKYGLGVAATGAAILVVWEMTAPDGSSFYRAVRPGWGGREMPWHDYEEQRTFSLGKVAISDYQPPEPMPPGDPTAPAEKVAVDLQLDPKFLQRLWEQSRIVPAPIVDRK